MEILDRQSQAHKRPSSGEENDCEDQRILSMETVETETFVNNTSMLLAAWMGLGCRRDWKTGGRAFSFEVLQLHTTSLHCTGSRQDYSAEKWLTDTVLLGCRCRRRRCHLWHPCHGGSIETNLSVGYPPLGGRRWALGASSFRQCPSMALRQCETTQQNSSFWRAKAQQKSLNPCLMAVWLRVATMLGSVASVGPKGMIRSGGKGFLLSLWWVAMLGIGRIPPTVG
ncbi:hypothetical protein QBC35DRAFT_264934 [Podospora australis]|uniref:Uncharacterized protein n=1 Tax=Podospora australis TaxID=1536484 RepID=A0AAN7AHB8_9PEZI|nr:hypothetical protein QBC35DRAFT_264934 [Podospora australis]